MVTQNNLRKSKYFQICENNHIYVRNYIPLENIRYGNILLIKEY